MPSGVGPASTRSSSARRIQDTAPLGLTDLTGETIRIVDPTHPLYDLRLPLLGVTTTPRLGRTCVVLLQPGVTRAIRLAATSLTAVVPSPVPCRLSVPAVQRLLAVVASLPDREPEDAHAARCECPAPDTAAAALRPAHALPPPPPVPLWTRPEQVWASLSPELRMRIRQTWLRVLQEVIDDGGER